jgi:hypothetical protein
MPIEQIKATRADGKMKITLGQVKIRIPFSRCLTFAGVRGVLAGGFVSMDMTETLQSGAIKEWGYQVALTPRSVDRKPRQ